MKRILIAIPTFENIAPETFKSIFNLEKTPGWNFDFEFVKGYDCARARNQIAKIGIKNKYDYIFMVDSDIILPENALTYLTQDTRDIVSGCYPRKSDSNLIEAFKKDYGGYDKEALYTKDELLNLKENRVLVEGCGFGCVLINTNIFDKIDYPYFRYVNYSNGELLSEDLYFCSEIRYAGVDIYLDTRVRCKHIGKNIFEI